MSKARLRVSLALWTRRHAYRQRRLSAAHARNDKAAVQKWGALLVKAGQMIRLRRHQLHPPTSPARTRIVAVAEQAAANYRRNPGAYHYLAGGVANTEILRPTPRNFRSDCSQFAVNTYRLAGVPCPGSGTYLYSNTDSIDNGGRVTYAPKPGDLGLYGVHRSHTHHVEVYVGHGRHIGHGSPPIDSITPGRPDYYLSFIND